MTIRTKAPCSHDVERDDRLPRGPSALLILALSLGLWSGLIATLVVA